MKPARLLLPAVASFLVIAVSHAVEKGKEPPPLKDKDKEISADHMLVPSPKDAFRALSNLTKDSKGEIDWKDVLAAALKDGSRKRAEYPDAFATALNAGVRIADGFVAFEAEDPDAIKDLGSVLLKMGDKLGVSKDFAGAGLRLTAAIGGSDWRKVRKGLSGMQDDLRKELENLDRGPEATLVAIGAWLEGLHLVSGALAEHYSPEGAEVLRQQRLIEVIKTRIDTMEGPAKTHALTAAIVAAAPELARLCTATDEAPVSKESVAKLHEISAALIEKIVTAGAK